MLREFLGQSSLDAENLPREVDGEGVGGRQQYQGGKPVISVAAVVSVSGTLDNVVQPCHEVAVGDFEEEDDAGVAASFGEHTCPLCYKVYSNRQHLRRHTKSTHSSALEELLPKKKFRCEECSKSYNRAQSLKRHALSHKHEERIVCKKSARFEQRKYSKSKSESSLSAYEQLRIRNIKEREDLFATLEIEQAKDLLLKSL